MCHNETLSSYDYLQFICDAFLIRGKDEDSDPLWKMFYDMKMKSYILEKQRIALTLAEGDMIYDLIRQTWCDLCACIEQSPIKPVNFYNVFKSVEIDFPVSN